MKRFFKLIPCLVLISMGATAEDGNTNAAPSSSGFSISGRTDQERIKFLKEVAQAYFKDDDFESAVSAYERILEIDPKDQESRYIIGHAYISAKQYGKAEASLTALVEENPENFQLLNNLAWLYATAEDPAYRDGQKAVQLAREAMVLAPNDHHIWSTLAEAYYINGDYEKAYRAINQMASLAMRYGTNITKESVDEYNEQIRKCKRAWDTQKMLEGDDEEEEKGEE